MIGKFLGTVLLIEAILLIAPLIVALIYSESPLPYIITIAALLLVSLPTKLLKPKKARIYAKGGFVCTALSWILLSAFGAVPFVISGAIPNYIDAFFETVSGFTTTGASIIPSGQIEGIEYGILFWRSFTHWIGGMGILVFMLALIPKSEGNVFLMRAEVPGPQKGKLVPKLRDSSIILYEIYLALTVFEIIALLFTGMPLFDCIVTSFGTMGTGGFSVLNDSIAGYSNPAAEWIIAIFLLLAGVNYNIYFFIISRKFRELKKNEELRAYLLITLVSTAIITANLLTSAGCDRVITIDLHADQIQGFFDIPVDHVYASKVFVPYIKNLKLENLSVATPDIGGAKRANTYASNLEAPLVICHKHRERPNVVGTMTAIGEVKGRDIIIFDDMVDTAGTLTKAAGMFMDMGAASVRAVITHPVLSGPAYERIAESQLTEIIVTDTLPLRADKDTSKFTVLSVADMLADVIERVHNYREISSQFLFGKK